MLSPEKNFSKQGDTQPSPEKSKNINDWTIALQDLSGSEDVTTDQKRKLSALARDLTEPREKGLSKLREMNMPQPKQILVPAVEFLQNPERYLQELASQKVYISLNPKRRDLPRYRTGISIAEAANFVKEKLASTNPIEYDVLGLEFLENIYGGSIVVNPDGRILVEFRRGQQGPVASGDETPEFSVKRDIFNLSFKYSFEDPALRQEIYNTILKIPHEGEGRDMKFTPGYYKFALVREDEKSSLHPLFFDYKSDKVYYLP